MDDDGPADHRTINSAIRAAPRGAIIRVRPGTYRELVELRSGVHIAGAGREQTTIEYFRGAAVIVGNAVRDATISGIRAQHVLDDAPCGSPVLVCVRCSNVNVEDSEILGSGYVGILLNRVTGFRLVRGRVAENRWAGVEALRSTDVVLSESLIERNRVGIAVGGSTVFVARSSRITANVAGVVVVPVPNQATSVRIIRSSVEGERHRILDFMARGDAHVEMQAAECPGSERPIERRELLRHPETDDEADDPLDDWVHHQLLGFEQLMRSSPHMSWRDCTGAAVAAPNPPAPPTRAPPTQPPGGNVPLVGSWERPSGETPDSVSLVLRIENGRLTGTMEVLSEIVESDGTVDYQTTHCTVRQSSAPDAPIVLAIRCRGGEEICAAQVSGSGTLTLAGTQCTLGGPMTRAAAR